MSKTTKKLTIVLIALMAALTIFMGVFMIKPVSALTISDVITIEDGAQVRMDSKSTEKDDTGMRFIIKVNDDNLATLIGEGGAYEGYTAKIGAAIIPVKYLGGSTRLDINQTYEDNSGDDLVLKIPFTSGQAEDGITTYYAVLTDIPESHYETGVAVNGYIELTNGTNTVYEQTTTTTIRSILQVANGFYNRNDIEEDDAIIYKAFMEDHLGSVQFDQETYSVFMTDGGANTIDFKVLANQYGFELDEEYFVKNNIEITSAENDIATVSGRTITAVAKGQTTISFEIDGKTVSANVKVEDKSSLAEALGTNQLATFDNKGYESLVVSAGTATNVQEISVGDYHGMTGVLKLSGAVEGGYTVFNFELPKPTTIYSQVTVILYVEVGSVGGDGGGFGFSASTTSAAWSEFGAAGIIQKGKWVPVVLNILDDDLISFAMSCEVIGADNPNATAGAGGYTVYYIAEILAGDQSGSFDSDIAIVKPKTNLDVGQVANFDCNEYLSLISVYPNDIANQTLEILPTYNGKTNVLHIGGTLTAWTKIAIKLPEKINSVVSIEYMIDVTGSGDASGWQIMNASEGWDASWQNSNADVTKWSLLSSSAWAGNSRFVIGVNSTITSFDLYISEVTTDVDKSVLADKLTDSQLAVYDSSAYLNYVASQDLITFEKEIINDPLDTSANPRKVLHVTAKTNPTPYYGTPRIVLYLPKAVTASFTMEYRMIYSAPDGSANAWGIMWPGTGPLTGGTWDLGLQPCTNVEQWTEWSIGGGYAGLDYVVIGLNNGAQTYDLYISLITEGNA